jgi:hypothetical protein
MQLQEKFGINHEISDGRYTKSIVKTHTFQLKALSYSLKSNF